ncbi:ABC transporter substrate-binding protein [Nocardia sp. NPDC059236]|uniref:ABC transporter substrate-binding protein n=2 Tax=unclassified Nocardia TaxID=2637762 RepID=UPI0036C1E6E6
MVAIALHSEERMAAPPMVVFSLFGAGVGAGWVFDATCDHVSVGAAVRLQVPFAGPVSETVEVIGRIAAVRPPSLIEIVHEQPWRGRIRLRFEPDQGGTRVRLFAELDEPGLHWLMRRRGYPVGSLSSPNPRLGLLTSKSGPGSLFAAASDHLAVLAVEEINAEGGLHGRPVELLIGDDATNTSVGVAEAWRLVRAGCKTILVATTSATYVAVSQALAGCDVLLVQTLMNEGGAKGRLRLQLGERNDDQLSSAARPLMQLAGGRRWFLAGNDYIWPRSTHVVARQVLPQFGAEIVGERYATLGTRDFSLTIEAILASGADVVLSTHVGADAAAFERQCHAMGVRNHALTLAPAMDESTLQHVGKAASSGLYTISGYFEQLPTDGNTTLLNRYRSAFGPWAPPLSTLSESVFEAVTIWWQAVRRVGGDDPRSVADEIRRGRFAGPRGEVTLDGSGRAQQTLYLTEATGTALKLAAL